MKFGVREICDVVFKAKAPTKVGNQVFQAGQPVLYIDTAKTSTVEGAATTVYAQGGKGNTRLIAWEGEKTLTFTVEDALLSPIGFSVLSGAGLFKGTSAESDPVHVHMTTSAIVDDGKVNLASALGNNAGNYEAGGKVICKTAPLFIQKSEADGSVTGEIVMAEDINDETSVITLVTEEEGQTVIEDGDKVVVDYYVIANGAKISELQIDAGNFAGYYYVEASTLFRREDTGKDMPAEITFPKVKIQSNFTFTMAAEGDPSTFTFTMDAFPGYTYFDDKKEVLCVIQVLDESAADASDIDSVMRHKDGETQIDVDLTDNDDDDATTKQTYDSWRGSSSSTTTTTTTETTNP